MAKVYPVDVEDYKIETINEIYGEAKLLGRYEYNHGKVLQNTDEVLFASVCGNIADGNIRDKTWIEVDGVYYDRDEVIDSLERQGFDVEDDI